MVRFVVIMEDALFCEVLENAFTAFLVFDAQHRIVYMNESAQSLFQTSRNRLLGQHHSKLPGLEQSLENMLQSAFKENASTTVHKHDLVLPITNSFKKINYTVKPLFFNSTNGEIEPKYAVLEMFSLDQGSPGLTSENLDRQDAQRNMVKGLAHEIRNPLGGLRGAAQLLHEELSDSELKDYTRLIVREADRLTGLVQRMQLQGKQIDSQPLNIHSVLQHIKKLILAENSEGELELIEDYDPSLPEVIGDYDQLVQLFMNLALNGIQASGDDAQIRFETRIDHQIMPGDKEKSQVVKVSIVDNGSGISSADLERVFDPLFTTKPNGTGLGLSIAADIVRINRGLIEVFSQPGETCFNIYLKVYKP